MGFEFEIVLRASLVGIGGTVAMDIWASTLQRLIGMPATNWATVGRWLGHMRKGAFSHDNIGAIAPVPCEAGVGWVFHYAIGIG